MKFFAPIVLLAAGALAAPNPDPTDLCERDDSNVNDIMTTVLNGIGNLDTAICGYNGGPGTELQKASDIMLTIIRTATTNANGLTPLTIEQAQAFQPLSDKLNAAGDKLLADLGNKVDLFAQSCACDTTRNWVSQVGSAVNTLMVTISAKFPAGGKGGDEITHFNQIFSEMGDKLATCAGKTCTAPGGPGGPGAPGYPSGKPTSAGAPAAPAPTGSYPGAKPTGPAAAGNGTKVAAPSSTVKPVVTAGAPMMTFSGAGLAAAIFAFLL